jgi:hypothetical protein
VVGSAWNRAASGAALPIVTPFAGGKSLPTDADKAHIGAHARADPRISNCPFPAAILSIYAISGACLYSVGR